MQNEKSMSKYLIALIILFSGYVYPCSMFLDENILWYSKHLEYEKKAAERAKKSSDSILVVRAVSWRSPIEEVNHSVLEEPIVFDGPNPKAGKIQTIHKIRVLEVIKGDFTVGDIIEVNVLEPERFAQGKRCREPSYESVANVEPFDNTFKYLIYLNKNNVLRHNLFVEWPELLTAEKEYSLLK